MGRFDLSDGEWAIVAPLLPGADGVRRGRPRLDDRKVLNGIFWRLRTGSPWADIPERYGPPTTCYNRFVRWRKLGVWDRIFDAVSAAYDGDIQMINRWAKRGVWLRVFEALAAKSPQSMHLIDSSIVRAHQHAAGGKRGARITPSVALVED